MIRNYLGLSAGGAVLMALAVPDCRELLVAAILIGIFWNYLADAAGELALDFAAWSLERQLAVSWHVDGDARTAFRLLVEEM